MYLYEFVIKFIDSKKPTLMTVESYELADQLAYCKEGITGGWIEEFDYTIVKEEW